MNSYPSDKELLELVAFHGNMNATARYLGIPPTTLRSHMSKQGLNNQAKQLNTQTLDPGSSPGSLSLEAAEIPVIRRRYDADKHYVYPLGDVHLGAREHKAEQWEEWLGYIFDHKETSMLGTGDFLNTALKDSVSDIYSETLNPRDGRKLLVNQLRPLAEDGRIDVIIRGNHEERITKATGDCPIEVVSEVLDIPYAPAAVLLVYEIGDQEYTVFLRHGTGNGQSVAAAEKSAVVIHADVYVTGHTHAQFAKTDEVFVLAEDGKSTVRKRRYYVSAGSFMGLEQYAAVRGYKATRIGAPRIFFDGTRHDVHVSL